MDAAYKDLVLSQKSLLLATVGAAGVPHLSYAPFCLDENSAFVIFISELAHHTSNLRGNPSCSLMFIEPEADCKNLFARKRVSFECKAVFVPRTDPAWEPLLSRLQARCGDTVALLKTLPDFQLFLLKPEQGRHVTGFGQSSDLTFTGG